MPRITMRDALTVLATATVSVAVTLGLTRWADRTVIDWHLTSETAAHFATVIAVVIGGCWAWFTTVHRRSLEPRAQLAHRHQLWADAGGSVLRVFIDLHNSSEAMLAPGDGMTYVQTPPDTPIDANEYASDQWMDIAAIRHAATFEEIRIDPKETETFVHDIRLPPGARYVQIYTWLKCEAYMKPLSDSVGDDRPTGEIELPFKDDSWNTITLIDLQEHKTQDLPISE